MSKTQGRDLVRRDAQIELAASQELDDVLGATVEISCGCGRSGCGEVIALPRGLYERAQRQERSLLVPGHELPRIKLGRYDAFVVVVEERPAAAAGTDT
jgi:hypothetical protein